MLYFAYNLGRWGQLFEGGILWCPVVNMGAGKNCKLPFGWPSYEINNGRDDKIMMYGQIGVPISIYINDFPQITNKNSTRSCKAGLY